MVLNLFSVLSFLFQRLFLTKVQIARKQGVSIGENTSIQKVSFGSEPYLVSIGKNCQITDGVKFFTHGGAHIFRQQCSRFDYFGKIIIGDNVYIGNNVLLMPGVTIGNNVMIGAGSVVSKSIPDNCVVAGVPARVIRDIDSYYNSIQQFNTNTYGLGKKEKKAILMSLSESNFITK